MIESPTPCITVSAQPGHEVLASSASFRDLVRRTFREDEEVSCRDLLSCGSDGADACNGESCPLVRVYRSEDKLLEHVPVRLRADGSLLSTEAHFFALWEPWDSYVSIWFGTTDAYE